MIMKYIISLILCLILTGCGGETIIKGEKGDQGIPGLPGIAGANGQDGTNGTNGTDGQNGTSCTVASVSPGIEAPYGGALITCGSSSTLLLNGEPGPQGEPAPMTPYTITEIIDVCNDTPNKYDEVLLRTQSGKLLASFSDNVNGYNTRLSELTAGNYMTSDGTNCFFTVDNDNTVTDQLGNIWTK